MMTLIENPRRAFDPFAPPLVEHGSVAALEAAAEDSEDLSHLTVKQLRALAADRELEVDPKARKADLIAALEAAAEDHDAVSA
jgi:hypothetical protein